MAAYRLSPQADGLAAVSRATPVYLDAGENLLHRHLGETDASLRMPMYGLFEALALDHAGPHARAAGLYVVICLQLALVFALVLLLGSVPGAFLAVCAFALLRYGEWTTDASLQPFFAVLVTFAAAAAAWRAAQPSPRRSLLVGAAIGASLLCRSSLVFLPPFLAVGAWLSEGRPSLRRWAPLLGGLVLVPYLFLLPWIGMNAVIHRSFIPLESESRDSNIAMGAEGVVTGMYGEWRAALDEPPPQDGVAAWAVHRVITHPLDYAKAVVARFLFVAGQHPVLYALGLLALAVSWAFPADRAVALCVAYFLGIHCLMTVIPIYFIPLLPLLVAAAAAALARRIPGQGATAGKNARRVGGRLLVACAIPILAWTAFVVFVLIRYAAMGSIERLTDRGILDTEVAAHPEDPWLRMERAKMEMQSDRAGAVADLTAALAARPGDAAIAGRLAWARFLGGDAEPLLALTHPDGAADIDEFEALKVLALLRVRGRPAALAQYALARERYVQSSGTFTQETKREIDATVRVHAAREAAFDGFLASVATRWRSPAEAATAIAELSALRPDSRTLAHEHALALHGAGRDAEAATLLTRLARGVPDDASAWKDLGVCEYALHRSADARRDLEKAVALEPGLLSAAVSLGYLESATGRCPAARDAYRRALAARPVEGEEWLRPVVAEALSKLTCAD